MFWQPASHKRLAQLADGLTTAVSFIIAYFIWNTIRINTTLSIGQPIQLSWYDLWKIMGLSIIWVIIFDKFKAYTYQRFTSLTREISIVFKTTVIGVLVFFAAIFLLRFQYIPRTYILIFTFTNFFCLTLEKIILFKVARIIHKKGKNRKKVLVVGTENKAIQFVEAFKKNMGWRLDIVGFLSNKDKEKGQTLLGEEIVGTFADFDEVIKKKVIDEVFVCVSDKDFATVKEILETCEREGIQVRLNSDFFGYLAKRVSLDYVCGLPIVSFYTVPNNEWKLIVKRVMDIFVSAFLLIVLSPVLLLFALLIKVSSKGPIFFKWKVVGVNRKPFRSWKFRTMVQNAEELQEKLTEKNEMKGPVFKMKNDPRITKVGRFLRKLSLDELPQLWSVLKGDMSLVGPRPPLQSEVLNFRSWHRRKLSVKPGMTCLWQVKGRNDISNFDDWAVLDMEYIDNWSIWLDLKILFMTALVVVRGTGK